MTRNLMHRSARPIFTNLIFIFSFLIVSAGWLRAQISGYVLTDSVLSDVPIRQIIYADINADGSPDVLSLVKGINRVYIYLTDGKGKFIQYDFFETRLIPVAFCMVRANSDIYPDLAILSRSGQIQLMLNKHSRGFTEGWGYQTGVMTSDIKATDLDQDGNEDLIIAEASENKLHIIWGNNETSDRETSGIITSLIPQKLAIDDYNQDGKPDILLRAEKTTVHLNKGERQFGVGNIIKTSFRDRNRAVHTTDNQDTNRQVYLHPAEKTIWLLTSRNQVANSSRNILLSDQTETDRNASTMLESYLYYASGKTELQPQAIDTLNRIASILYSNPKARLIVSSHTDSDDSFSANLHLSALRTQQVIQYLQQKGIDTQRLIGRAYGEVLPLAPNTSNANKQQNRRTELIIVK